MHALAPRYHQNAARKMLGSNFFGRFQIVCLPEKISCDQNDPIANKVGSHEQSRPNETSASLLIHGRYNPSAG
jgi:hypothetical protein